ncbi:MAG TPA: hypothetical protein ENI20_08910 [Bacteroides sp.]|nr:hypothetical protein [Bacteroides sp.]
MSKKIYLLGIVLLISSNASEIFAQDAKHYNPLYWVQGVYNPGRSGIRTDADVADLVDDIYAKGWRGVLYWGASRAGSEMDYYYKSPFLEQQTWAVEKEDGLSSFVKASHDKGLKVMVNMEGVNPWHWKQNQWTPENIKYVADDLAAAGADAVFEECFEVNSAVFVSFARQLKSNGVDYISGTDPMLLREANFSTLWPETAVINIYNYYLKRDKIFNIATLAQHGSLGYGWAKYWGKPTSLITPLGRNWGIALDYSSAVLPYICMIRALQFRVDNYIVFGGMDKFDPIGTQAWINEYVEKQEADRPLMNIVVLLQKETDYSGSETGSDSWNRLFNSGDAITSGAMNAGYNIMVSDKVMPADAYWIYAAGGSNEILPPEVVALFNTDKPVFIQSGSSIPGGSQISPGWKTALEECGIDGSQAFSYGRGSESPSEVSLPQSQEQDLPYTGYYKETYLRVTGSDVQRGMDLRSGTIIPKDAITDGTVYCSPNKTYGKGPYIVGKNDKYLVTATALNWEVAYPISHLLSDAGILPSSNVWGIAGRKVTALLAIETTELEITIPGLDDGSMIRVVIWDKEGNKKSEETLAYNAPYINMLKEYDFILINAEE